mmetsp:Transcript_1471/g.2415  ORF Transcript_1471/g.2415 Transcript_1471/m.2415 type:complete len:107 (-) Transcript_1471:108-428(-)|eukprot:CAMPEP_0174968164 /NCGR_PEP_ID=MMETSP0004_2-20121128/7975_1 /TAXON_ID=420556 /ORGANISM="Ochromonas sp., Strain CCMP1393" /LENGTH=106 /DNA_ID=CAMNT_0016217353 /DNA_START=105 /DNA_END=425 /DNA_ORIENTATION=+
MWRFGGSTARRVFQNKVAVRHFGAGGHHGPHVPEFYDKLGKYCLVTAYVWVMYKLKQDNGQLFGYYQPWLHEHDHEHFHFTTEDEDGFGVPQLAEEEDDDEEWEEE